MHEPTMTVPFRRANPQKGKSAIDARSCSSNGNRTFTGGPLLAGSADPVRNLLILASTTIAAAAIGYVQFERRDL